MRCPRCSQGLVETTYEGVKVDLCASCKGIWLDQGELKPILDAQILQFDAATLERGRAGPKMGIPDAEKQSIEACPKCSKPMAAMNFGANSGIIVDVCSGHGMWLDRQELETIQAIHEHWSGLKSDPHFQLKMSGVLANEKLAADLKSREAIARVLDKFPVLSRFLGKLFGIS